MSRKIQIASVVICAFSLSACLSFNPNSYYRAYNDDNTPMYPDSYDGVNYGGYYEKKQVVVPETYLMNSSRAPTSHKDQDRSWVSSQNPQGYTIELADGDKAAQVADKLYKAPKNDRMAQVRYEQGGATHYKGLYGSYSSMEAAQQALNALPEDVRNGASVKNWGSVQSSVNQ